MYSYGAGAREASLLSVFHDWSGAAIELHSHAQTLTGDAGTYSTADRALYVPMKIPHTINVNKVWWTNGSAVAGNIDVGVFTTGGTRMVSSGSTAQSGTNAVQSVDVTDTLLTRGLYFFAISCSSTSSRFAGALNCPERILYLTGTRFENSAVPLPSTATFSEFTGTSSLLLPIFGISVRSEV